MKHLKKFNENSDTTETKIRSKLQELIDSCLAYSEDKIKANVLYHKRADNKHSYSVTIKVNTLDQEVIENVAKLVELLPDMGFSFIYDAPIKIWADMKPISITLEDLIENLDSWLKCDIDFFWLEFIWW